MYCNQCGAWLDENAKFCTQCGSSVDRTPNAASGTDFSQQQSGSWNASANTGVPYSATPYANYGQPLGSYATSGMTTAKMSRCRNCKMEFVSNGTGCPRCHSLMIDDDPDKWMGILALIFGFLGGWLGFVFAGLGMKSAKRTRNQQLKTMCIVAIVICAISLIFQLILVPAIVNEMF